MAIAALAVATAVATGAVVVGSDADPSQLDQARALVASDDGFGTGLEAGETLARAAQHLEQELADCRRQRLGTTCHALSAALGYAQVLAPWVLVCTAPGRHEARTRMASYLATVATVAPDAPEVPEPSPLPDCRS